VILSELIPNDLSWRLNPNWLVPWPRPGKFGVVGDVASLILTGGGCVLLGGCKARAGKLSLAQAALKPHVEILGRKVPASGVREGFFNRL